MFEYGIGSFVQQVIVLLPALLFALTIHEAAHAKVADILGDSTARLEGRVTLNPLSHLDPWGTLMIFIAGIGWGKPVPVNPVYLKNPRRDLLWISLAGQAANVAGGIVCGVLLGSMINYLHGGAALGAPTWLVPLGKFLSRAMTLNFALAFFNLLPIYPLDGAKVLSGLLPLRQAISFSRLEPYGMFILLGILVLERVVHFPILWRIIGTPVNYLTRFAISLTI